MTRLINGCLAAVLAMILAAPVMAEEGQPQGSGSSSGGGWHQFTQDMKEAGHNIGQAGKEVGHNVGQAGKEVGLGVADGAKKGSKAVKEYFAPDSGGSNKGGNSK